MLEELNHSGYIVIKRKTGKRKTINCRYAYEFKDGLLFIFAFEDVPEISGDRVVLGTGFDQVNYLFFASTEITDDWSNKYPKRIRIDYVVKNFKNDAICNQAIFSFDELQYFCPSASVVQEDSTGNVTFLSERKELKSFDITVDSKLCHVCFRLRNEGKTGFEKSHMTAITDIVISFPETTDYEFLKKIYLVVDKVFAFICNRCNTTCLSMIVIGKYKCIDLKDGKKVKRMIPFNSNIFYFDNYREEPENNEVIKNTWWANGFFQHIDALFDLVAKDLSGIEDENGRGTISIDSIHPSLKRRRKIDLQLSLQIASAFEFYVRKYLPNMIEEKKYHKEVKQALEQIYETSKGKKKKKLVKDLIDHVVIEPALEDKIWKVYNGYGKWKPVKPCISEVWFNENEIRKLGSEMNKWRNDLAHSKRKYKPSANTIRAVRLIEHLNYSIVLRKLGYTDEEIMDILSHVLIHEIFVAKYPDLNDFLSSK